MPARLFSLAEVARRSQAPLSVAYRLLHAGEITPDFVTERFALFAETRLPAIAEVFVAHLPVGAAVVDAIQKRSSRSHTPPETHHPHKAGVQRSAKRKAIR